MEEISQQEVAQRKRRFRQEDELERERTRYQRWLVRIRPLTGAWLSSLIIFLLFLMLPDHQRGSWLQFFADPYLNDLFTISLFLTPLVLLTFIIGVVSLTRYLQTGLKGDRSAEGVEEAILVLDSKLSTRIRHLEDRLNDAALSTHDITDAEKTELINFMRESIERDAKANFIKDIEDSIAERQGQGELQSLYEKITERLKRELAALSRRGIVNLIIGMILAAFGILVLGFFVLIMTKESPPEDPLAFISTFLPRVSIVIVVEVFAYFFLRLYSTSLMEIKYFQNEITNVEAKFLALQTAIQREDEKAVREVTLQMAQTERNYILQKGQTTVDLERSRIEKEVITSWTRSLLNMLPRRP